MRNTETKKQKKEKSEISRMIYAKFKKFMTLNLLYVSNRSYVFSILVIRDRDEGCLIKITIV